MRALTVRPPFAQLIALEMKRRETRSNPPPEEQLGRQIAIHAGKNVVENEKLWDAIKKNYSGGGTFDERLFREPAGKIVATARIANAAVIIDRTGEGIMVSTMKEVPLEIADDHNALAVRYIMDYENFGNYHVDNWVWFLTEIEPLRTPVQAKGQLGLWKLPQCDWDGDEMWTACDVHDVLIQGCPNCRLAPFDICRKHMAQATECAIDSLEGADK